MITSSTAPDRGRALDQSVQRERGEVDGVDVLERAVPPPWGVRTASTIDGRGMGASSVLDQPVNCYRRGLHSGPCPQHGPFLRRRRHGPARSARDLLRRLRGGLGDREVDPTELACNPAGTVHGGVYGVVHDAAMNFATNAALESGDRAATLELKVLDDCERRRPATCCQSEAKSCGSPARSRTSRRRSATPTQAVSKGTERSSCVGRQIARPRRRRRDAGGRRRLRDHGSGITFVAAPPGSP